MTTATEHLENASSEYDRKIEEGCSAQRAYEVAMDYLEDFISDNDVYRRALDMFIDRHGGYPDPIDCD